MLKPGTTEYRMLHFWVEKQLGKPQHCVNCNSRDEKKYEWANISGRYLKDITDWKRLCSSCHRNFDYNGMCGKRLHEISGDNIYIVPGTGQRQCLACRRIARKKQYQLFKARKASI